MKTMHGVAWLVSKVGLIGNVGSSACTRRQTSLPAGHRDAEA